MFSRFWAWYQRHSLLVLTGTTLLFLIQVFHLYWLFTDVVIFRLTGESVFVFPDFWGTLSTILDYTEIPAIISSSILYIHFLRQKFSYKHVWYLLFINIQWLHIFWITDEVVIETFTKGVGLFIWPATIAWIAIGIDYLELPVIYDTVKRTIIEIKNRLAKKKREDEKTS